MKKFLMIIVSAVIVLMFSVPAFAAGITDEELNGYLAGTMTVKEFKEEYLASWEIDLKDYESLDELREDFGEPLTEENLANYLEENQISEEELKDILIEYGELEEGQSILDGEYLQFTSDLDFYLEDEEDYQLTDEDYEAMKEDFYAEIKDMFDELSITRAEYDALFDHVNTVRKDTDITSSIEELDVLAGEMMSVGDFETIDEISDEEIAQMLKIYDEIQRIFQVKFTYALVKDGVEKELSLEALMQLEDPGKASLKVYVTDLNGKLLLDLIVTPEMFGSEFIEKTGSDLKGSTEVVKEVQQKEVQQKEVKHKEMKHKVPIKTEKGGKLPKTAGNYMAGMLFGILLLGGSFVFLKKARSVK
ncbi:processed acidic surface protein [Peribacillus cavernae]|uniref:Processed acidic surface protein n=1 Tax=Peribacillus cavernae TaxID=1674310 RepID=A0A3S0U1E0_9BACI|nr:processed acidic surface protein [Peribacillus cavernae]MDQ0220020.1 processed acidic surface protein [Peribacillus cavernae]RUQ32081.1 processed acidic surface protein [Peribacillus cavernae]